MFGLTNQKMIRILTLCLISIGLTLWFNPVLNGQTEGGDSPETVFKTAQAAGAKKDFSTLTKLVAPSERPLLAFGTDMAVGMFVEFSEGENVDELKKKYQEIQDTYGIKIGDDTEGGTLQITQDTPQEVIDAHIRQRAENLYGHVDVVKYVPDLIELIVNLPEMAEQTFFPREELSDLKIEGDLATGKAGEKEIKFIREDGRWFLTADVME